MNVKGDKNKNYLKKRKQIYRVGRVRLLTARECVENEMKFYCGNENLFKTK